MAKRPLPTPELLRQLLSYDPDSGSLIWRARDASALALLGISTTQRICDQWNTRFAGRPALTGIDGFGYYQGSIFAHCVKAHRVIWALAYGEWPEGVIDHINGDGRDNRLSNLRDVSHGQNLRNCRRSKRNKSGATGVSQNPKTGRWIASIHYRREYISLGTHDTFEKACAARREAEVELGFGEGHGSQRKWHNVYVKKVDRL